MGVTGLWKLIDSSGKPVPLDTLENKVLAIDISIWLHQVIKGFQDNKGNALAHAHLLGLFHRLCKLLYYRIKPVFVFDGGVPHLKKETITKRNRSRNKLLDEADRLQQLLLNSLAKEKVVQRALGAGASEILKSPPKPKQTSKKPDQDDMFKLPDLPNPEVINNSQSSCSSFHSSESDSSFEEKNLRYSYQTNLQTIDVTSSHFQSLPADVRHEILTDIKETRKQSSWGKLHELPTQSDDFSVYQMRRLLKRRQVQVSLEEAEKQMEGKSLTLSELRVFLSEEGIVTPSTTEYVTKRIASDENTRYLLVRDLKKAIENAEKIEQKREENMKEEAKYGEGGSKDNLGEEFDEELQRAIKLSLEASAVYKDEDYDCDEIKMNKEQRKQLRTAALSLARTYMIEYGGMNDDDIKSLLETTQSTQDVDSSFRYNDSFVLKGFKKESDSEEDSKENLSEKKPEEQTSNDIGPNHLSTIKYIENPPEIYKSFPDITLKSIEEQENLEKRENDGVDIAIISSDSDSDSDLVEVVEEKNDTEKLACSENRLEILVNLSKDLKDEDDIFADVFEKQSQSSQPITLSSETMGSGVLKYSESTISSEGNKLEEEETDTINDNETLLAKFEENTNISKISEELPELNSAVNIIKAEDPKDILAKLKEDLVKGPNITLDDIKPATEKEISSESIVSQSEVEECKVLKPTVIEILEDLKREATKIPTINLDDINIDLNKSCEIIEIADDEICTTAKTPSKKGTNIENYFVPEYSIKRTPEKPQVVEETPPKVKSPFFVNKTPGSSSGKERHVLVKEDELPAKRSTKVSKSLFPESDLDVVIADNEQNQPIDPLDIAAQALKEHKTTEQLESLAKNIAQEKKDLEYESNRQNRMGVSITEKMNSECMHLLRLFGIPYIVAPMEAEAQCAFLDAMKLTDGTITDDSDIWLFGGRTVYKNFFNQKKHVFEFKVDNIEKLYSVDREKLIQLAILVGSDYTSGISGIGTVTALEILAAFPQTPQKDGETNQMMSILSSLRKFRDWWRNGKNIGVGGKTALKSKLKNIELIEGFPSKAVVEAYLYPKVDSNREKFTWGTPDVETIREFTKKTFGWTRTKTDEILNPVLKRMNEKKVQSSIKNYFTVKSALSTPRELKVSKRVQKAIQKIAGGTNGVIEEEEVVPKKPKVSKPKTKKSDDTKQGIGAVKTRKKRTHPSTTKGTAAEPSTSAVVELLDESEGSPPKLPKKSPHFPDSNQVIPQRESNLLEMQNRKAKAAELFKKSQTSQKQRKKVLN